MTWTTEKPTVPGWYWWRRPYGKREIQTIIRVKEYKFQPGIVFIYSGRRIEDCRGEWAGPLEPPEECQHQYDKAYGTCGICGHSLMEGT
jgi:hypothetical protein